MEQKLPNHERRVLTWARDRSGTEGWQIDCYCPKLGGWLEAKTWEMEVLYWEDLPPGRNGLHEKV